MNLSNVCKQYGHTPVLQHIDLNIQMGSIVGLAGSSGSGKSTLLRCIQKLESIDSGTIEYTGTCSYMFQDFQLFPHMTVLENILYAPQFRFKNKNLQTEALHLLAKLGLKTKENAFPSKLSGGQKQRVALARCLMMKPNILLCDEPTSGLDVATIEDVLQLLKTIHQKGMTILIASHDLNFLTRIAERIIVLKNGSIAKDIKASDLTNPIESFKRAHTRHALLN